MGKRATGRAYGDNDETEVEKNTNTASFAFEFQRSQVKSEQNDFLAILSLDHALCSPMASKKTFQS